MIQSINATVRMSDNTTRAGWWVAGTLGGEVFDFELPPDDYDLYRTWQLMIPFALSETDPHPTRGSDYRVATREYQESEGRKVEVTHMLPPLDDL
jgi:hypothetical protein